MTATHTENHFTEAAFANHLKQWDALPWLQELKRKHWQDFTTLPMPQRTNERWRFTKLSQLTLDGFKPVETSAAPATGSAPMLADTASARLTFVDNQLASKETDLPDGVVVSTFAEAWDTHREQLESHLSQRAAVLGMDKFFALHMALLANGVLIHVPKNVVLNAPIELQYLSHNGGTLLTPHTLIIGDDNSELEVIEYHGCTLEASADKTPVLCIGAGTVVAGTGAHVRRVIVQNHAEGTHVYQSEEANCGRDADLVSTAVNLGGRYARFEGHTIADGPGADVHLYSLAAPVGKQVFDQRTLQTHRAPNARSDLLFKNALLDNSQTIFSGLIFVEDDAQQTDAYQTNRNLLLAPTAEANSLPGLEINANDVKCSHGATTGQVSKEELFYLNARGIPKRSAFELLVYGFFEEVLDKISNEDVHARLSEMVQRKFIA